MIRGQVDVDSTFFIMFFEVIFGRGFTTFFSRRLKTIKA
jgi:hypothetical protein